MRARPVDPFGSKKVRRPRPTPPVDEVVLGVASWPDGAAYDGWDLDPAGDSPGDDDESDDSAGDEES